MLLLLLHKKLSSSFAGSSFCAIVNEWSPNGECSGFEYGLKKLLTQNMSDLMSWTRTCMTGQWNCTNGRDRRTSHGMGSGHDISSPRLWMQTVFPLIINFLVWDLKQQRSFKAAVPTVERQLSRKYQMGSVRKDSPEKQEAKILWTAFVMMHHKKPQESKRCVSSVNLGDIHSFQGWCDVWRYFDLGRQRSGTVSWVTSPTWWIRCSPPAWYSN